MAQFHLLDPHYDEHHRGRLTAEGEVLPVLRVRTHDRFLEEMRYDERYTPLLQRAGLDVLSYQVRRGLPTFNPAALTALVDRWRPETHTFHLPCGEMTVTLEDCQKILGLSIMGRPVTGQASPGGWRQRVEAFLGRLLPDELRGSHNTGVPLTWLRQSFGQCPPGADEQTVGYHC
ncbi:protein MAINTENANCE OF MERISTEMS-like [Zea mays]|nr:protein MAINTENANCE OF MERISTEMS-like [Zea mays]